ncbi:hypothetical protein [Pinibacter soli]|uniref:ParB/Sulfiredoxin domain-containing protein n=1 Tax=Pinibacter soli TaxID=3044211 RepID=A0ABT6RAA0_9BACT|nr:hypothetical protein [Pinibacter soli]MDI3319497.1 hypothetical protein [Pinibacter soli]
MNVTHKTIPITNLAVSIDNPRFETTTNQRDAISTMIEDQAPKLLKLAKDIIDFGLNPAKKICVIPSEKPSGQFTVLEGNRRITILKILSNTNIVDGKHASFIKSIKKLSEAFQKNPIKNVECVIFPDSDSALKWIELEHTGENEGIGVVSWDAQQRARFDKKVKGTTPLALQAIELMHRSEFTPKKIKEALPNLTISNLERLLGDPDVRDLLGIKLQDKVLYSELEEKEVMKGLGKIADDFLFNDYTVYNIDKKKDRKTYLESFTKQDIPSKTKKSTDGPWHLISKSAPKVAEDEKSKAKNKKSAPLPYDRKTLIPRDCVMTINDNRLNSIYRELKNLEVDEFVNATAVLFRVFIELSVDHLIATKKGKVFQGIKKMTPLKEKVEKSIKYFEDSHLIEDDKLKAINVAIQNNHSIFSIDTFNAYIHNRHISPIAKDLKVTWDNIQVFVEKIWEISN